MKRSANKTEAGKEQQASKFNSSFDRVVKTFAKDRQVCLGNRKGFGAGALKVNGKIFAMMPSKNEFVVKLAQKRVNELVNAGKGNRFDPGHGRPMKEWIVVKAETKNWVELANEACEFVKHGE
jgi:hypothetical protein